MDIVRLLVMTVPGFYEKDAEALLEGLFASIGTIDNASISLVSRSLDFDRDRYNVKVTGVNEQEFGLTDRVVNRLKYPQYILLALVYRLTGKYVCNDKLVVENDSWRELCESDVILTGIDDSFTTLYGTLPFYHNFYNILLGTLLDKKVVLYGGSIGPYQGKWFEMLGRYILSKPDLITLGDERSREYVRKIGVRNPEIHVTADLTFLPGPAPEERIEGILEKEGIGRERRPLIGAAFSRAIIKQTLPKAGNIEQNMQFVKVIARALDDLVEKTGATIVFLPYGFGPCDYYDDRITLNYFRNEMKMKDQAIILKNRYSPGELRGLIGKCDLFIGSRAHALISSAVIGVPFIALDYGSFEMSGIIGRMLRCEDSIIYVKDTGLDKFSNKIMDIWAQRDRIRKELEQKTPATKERALQNAILLRNIIARHGPGGN